MKLDWAKNGNVEAWQIPQQKEAWKNSLNFVSQAVVNPCLLLQANADCNLVLKWVKKDDKNELEGRRLCRLFEFWLPLVRTETFVEDIGKAEKHPQLIKSIQTGTKAIIYWANFYL